MMPNLPSNPRAGVLAALPGLVLLLLFASLPLPSRAQDLADEPGPLPTLDITPGGLTAYRTAVLRFREAGSPVGTEHIEELRNEIESALAFSSVVEPLDHDAYLGSEESTPLELKLGFDCDTWKQSGADALVQGEVRADGPTVRAEIRVWDIARCSELKLGKLEGGREGLARMGRLIADEVIEALTGVRGVSSTEIAFVSDRSGSREVYVMSSDGRDQRPATKSDRIKLFPDWLPGGRAIMYTSYGSLQPGLFITSRSKGIRAGPILRDFMPGVPKYKGRLDPSGESLALVTSVDGAAEIFRVKRRGIEARRLTNHPAIDIAPSWSPDGRQIVFVSDRSGSPQLYLMDRDGGSLRRLTYTGAYNSAPSWSPDGRWIAYEARVRGQFDLWLIDPSGQINFPIVEHPRSDEAPSWSPDGRKLVFSSRRRGRFDLYVSDWNGENVHRLTQKAGRNIHPAWGPRPQ